MTVWPISISTVIGRNKPLEEVLRAISCAGFRLVEIFPGHIPELMTKDHRPLLAELGLQIGTIHLPFVGKDITDPDSGKRKGVLEELKGIIKCAPKYEVPMFILHPNSYSVVQDEDDYHTRQAAFEDSVTQLIPHARKAGARLAIENMIGSIDERFGCFAFEIAHWVQKQDDPVLGACIDTTHAILNGEDIEQAVLEAGSWLVAIHASDNIPGEHLHALPGRGDMNWEDFVCALKRVNYQGLFTMELYETEAWKSDLVLALQKANTLAKR
ncbi:MAG: sugar phosphate isomerase/epimerase [Firmicutes bacterium]|nr:sugar phosphate isomerase/epimerase [Bacillota bacterium]